MTYGAIMTPRQALLSTLALALTFSWTVTANPSLAAERTGTLVLYSTTEGAVVEVDGEVVGTTPLEAGVTVPVGTHKIHVRLRGWTEYLDTFEVRRNKTTELEVDLIPIAGIVTVNTADPGATVKIDGKVMGVTPFDQDIEVGKRTLTISRPGYEAKTETLDIAPGERYALTLTLDALPDVGAASGTPIYEKWWFWTIIGVAVAGGAAAAIAVTTTGGADPPPQPQHLIRIPLSPGR